MTVFVSFLLLRQIRELTSFMKDKFLSDSWLQTSQPSGLWPHCLGPCSIIAAMCGGRGFWGTEREDTEAPGVFKAKSPETHPPSVRTISQRSHHFQQSHGLGSKPLTWALGGSYSSNEEYNNNGSFQSTPGPHQSRLWALTLSLFPVEHWAVWDGLNPRFDQLC